MKPELAKALSKALYALAEAIENEATAAEAPAPVISAPIVEPPKAAPAKKAPAKETPKPAPVVVIDVEKVTEACVEAAKALGPDGRAKVKKVLVDIGGSATVKDIDPAKYAVLIETLKALPETLPAGGADEW
jgi:hypothetical protein